jgi:hypothetical protein
LQEAGKTAGAPPQDHQDEDEPDRQQQLDAVLSEKNSTRIS